MRKYELATSTHWKFDSTGKIPFTESIERIVRAGFKNLDFGFLNMVSNRELPFLSDSYLDWAREVGQFTDSIGAKFVQAHAPDPSDHDRRIELAKRSLLCCAQLGIPWLVFHSPSRGRLGHKKESAIDYKHYFTYESHQSVNPLPNSIADDAMRMMYRIGESILAM